MWVCYSYIVTKLRGGVGKENLNMSILVIKLLLLLTTTMQKEPLWNTLSLNKSENNKLINKSANLLIISNFFIIIYWNDYKAWSYLPQNQNSIYTKSLKQF